MRRQRVFLVLASSLVLVTASATAGYRWLTNTRPVSATDAVERYREELAIEATPTPAAPIATPAATGGRTGRAAPAASARPAGPAATARAAPTPAPAATLRQPAPGVYTFRTQGWEEAGFRRSYPPETQRILRLPDRQTMTNHHIFSEEHEEWFTLRSQERGGVMLERRMRVTFGPVTVDKTVTFDPPLLGVPVPHRLGETWQGSWQGTTSGTYTGKTIEHRKIRIGDEDVEVFVNQLDMKLQGDTQGDITVKLWFAPRYGMTVREDGVYDMRGGGPGPYRTEYTVTLTSLQPRS